MAVLIVLIVLVTQLPRTYSPSGVNITIPVIQETVASPTIAPDAKETAIQQELQTRAAILLTPSPAPGTLKPTLVGTSEPLPTGDVPRQIAGAGTIIWGFSSPFPAAEFQMMNKWIEVSGSNTIEVFAGAERNPNDWQDVAQGIIIVNAVTGDSAASDLYESPTQAGPTQIVGAQGERLILSSQNGTTFYFDIPTRQFVAGLIVTVTPAIPTDTPAPTAYPGS